jgi:hypothetical protein
LAFPNVAAGSYVVAVQALDVNGASMGSPLSSAAIVVPAGTAQFDAPATIAVALG